MKKIYIRTFGCQMNDRDSEALLGLFIDQDYVVCEEPKDADIILVNTCSVREHAEDRAISFLGSFKKLSQSTVNSQQSTDKKKKTVDNGQPTMDVPKRHKPILGLIGCMARNRGEELFKKMKHIDLICGPASLDNIPTYIEKIKNENERILDIADKRRSEVFYQAGFREKSDSAQVVISTGCSNYCTYCVVPYVRGPMRPRVTRDIIDEIRRNVKLGVKNITLLGQNVNDYQFKHHMPGHSQSISFIDLLKMVEKIDGIKELNFLTSHPKNTSTELFDFMSRSKKIKKHIHLPFQSGSDRILKLMNRGYTKNEYLRLADTFKKIVGGTISSDVIVGFPTESNDDFLDTKEVLETVKFKYGYIFKYSPRPHSKALEMDDDVPKDVKEKRHKILLDLQKEISGLQK